MRDRVKYFIRLLSSTLFDGNYIWKGEDEKKTVRVCNIYCMLCIACILVGMVAGLVVGMVPNMVTCMVVGMVANMDVM